MCNNLKLVGNNFKSTTTYVLIEIDRKNQNREEAKIEERKYKRKEQQTDIKRTRQISQKEHMFAISSNSQKLKSNDICF